MRQLISSLAVTLQILICTLILVSCESDQNVDNDQQTTNIKLENAELIALGAIHSSLFSQVNTSLYDFLNFDILNFEILNDENDVGYDTSGLDYQFSQSCEGGGDIIYQTSRDPFKGDSPSAYQKGDALSVAYNECDNALGSVFNGEVDARYKSIEGLNNTFVEVDTSHCIANLIDDWDGISNNDHSEIVAAAQSLMTTISSDVESPNVFVDLSYKNYDIVIVLGDELVINRISNGLQAESILFKETDLTPEDDETGQEREKAVIAIYEPGITLEDELIFVNLQLGRQVVNGEESLVYLSEGNRIYSAVDGVAKEINCQHHERTLIADVKNLSTEKGDLITTIDGSLDIFQSSTDFARFDNSILDSDFDVTVQQNNDISSYEMRSFTALNRVDIDTGVYQLDVNGRIKSDDLFGTIELINSSVTGHVTQEHPNAGSISIQGKGLEQILVRVEDFLITLLIDFNGDSTGSQSSDLDATIRTTWEELLERDFKEVEFD